MPSGPTFDDGTATLARDRPRPLGAILSLSDCTAAPPRFELRDGLCRVGSGDDCDIVVSEATVSRHHAEVSLVPEGVQVRDLDSRNGIRYLGQSVDTIVLGSGGNLELGAATLSIAIDHGALGEALAPYPSDVYRGMLGGSLAMRRLFAKLERLEGSLVSVLVEGESGVGKELVAHALHQGSEVSSGPFVSINCGAVARELVASELFGHQRGAFTGAHEPRRGAFESADGGTLFLDELGELPLEVQPMLLRALESGEIQPVGSDERRRVRVRVVAATNRELREEVAAGRFREDLFYRAAVVVLTVPPLRERLEDIAVLAQAFAAAQGIDRLTHEVVQRLAARSWPGNVRELRNAVMAYAALGELPRPVTDTTNPLVDTVLAELVDVAKPYADQKDAVIERFTSAYLEALMKHTRGNQTAAAQLAGLTRTYLGRLLDKHGIDKGRR